MNIPVNVAMTSHHVQCAFDSLANLVSLEYGVTITQFVNQIRNSAKWCIQIHSSFHHLQRWIDTKMM